jgi:ubiquitin-like 1-activating enzyme E1 B
MAAAIAGVFQPEMQNLIKESKVLLVGAGGIGCEVLKNLVLTGFSELEIIDLDTIEVSNLNRQFLFNKESVGKAKSHVAKTSVLKFNPNVNITSHLGDIMDTKYGVAFFNKFKLVINALDNKKARSHVNRMCLSCDIPLIESGTMGYTGQVEFIKKGVSLCYECYPKPEPKSYPMCTIRNTPKEPIHCIIWSKFLFGQLFGESDEDVSMDEAVSQDGSEKMSARNWAIDNDYNPKKLLKKVFYDDIQYLLSMEDLYKDKEIKPVLLDEALFNQEQVDYDHIPDSELLTLEQCISMFLDCTSSIKQKLKTSKNGCLVWDKDELCCIK